MRTPVEEAENARHALTYPLDGCDAVLIRFIQNNFFELSADVVRDFQTQMLCRLNLFAAGVDGPTAIEKFVLYFLGSAEFRGYRSTLCL